MKVLKWVHDAVYPWNEFTCTYAADKVVLEILNLNRCPGDEETCDHAALNGHLNILQFALENGCPWHPQTYTIATGNDQLEVLRYARNNGC